MRFAIPLLLLLSCKTEQRRHEERLCLMHVQEAHYLAQGISERIFRERIVKPKLLLDLEEETTAVLLCYEELMK